MSPIMSAKRARPSDQGTEEVGSPSLLFFSCLLGNRNRSISILLLLCYCLIFIFNEVTLLNLTLFSYNFYTWLIVVFCLFVKSLHEWNVTKINSCVTFEYHWPVNILVPLSLSPCSLSQLIDADSPVWHVKTLQKHVRLCFIS